jgi:hypothetical protein
MCIRGASEIQSKVLEKIKNPDVRVYAVYLPILRGDKESDVPLATKRLPDERASYFWDGKGEMAQSYAHVLKLPAGYVAWDVYMVFNRDAEWKNDPPAPDYWMHQLGGVMPERQLNGERFAEETNKLLPVTKK